MQGRQQHSTVPFRNFLYIFGGCFAFNRKRHIRESTNGILEYDTTNGFINLIKTKGVSVSVRKQHTAVAYRHSMVVFGGTSENGLIHQDMLVFNFED